MTKAEEKAAEAAVKIHDTAVKEGEEYAKTHGRTIFEEVCYGRGFKTGYIRGYKEAYEQAEKDIIDKACEYWSQRISINKEIETNEDGQPYADSYLNWLEERDKAVKEILSDFRKAME